MVRSTFRSPIDLSTLTNYNPLIINYSWRSGRLFGVPVDIHWSFLLVPIAILYFSWQPGYGLNYEALTWYSTVSVLLFSFVLLHELGHALAARNRGVVAERIVLFPLGGGAYLPEQPKQLWAEVFVYAAGPLANLALAGIALPVLLSHPDGELILRGYVNPASNMVINPNRFNQLLGMTFAVNLLLALGNLLPAYPLDGGRILRALLRRPLGARQATVVVTVLGAIIGLALIWLSTVMFNPFLAVGAVFIIGMSLMEYRNGWQRRRLAGRKLKAILRPPLSPEQKLYPQSVVNKATGLFSATGWPVLPVHDNWNNLLGFVELALLEEEVKDHNLSLREYFEPEFVTAAPGEDLLVITERIVDANVYGAAIYGERGRLLGYVFTEDIMTLLDTPWRAFKRGLRPR
jgi:Zn-dependent protease